MWDFINRRRELVADHERAVRLLNMRAASIQPLSRQDFVQASRALNVNPAHLRAFHSVESSQQGFAPNGRLIILYEPHRVHIETGGRLTGRKFDWQWQGKPILIPLSYRGWKRLPRKHPDAWHPYREDQSGRWEMLFTAYLYEPNALRGVTWGAFQVLGKWAEDLGFNDALHMIEHLYQGEETHLEIAIRYLKMVDGISALRRGEWQRLARLYNGRGNVHEYAPKLQVAARRAYAEFDMGTRTRTA